MYCSIVLLQNQSFVYNFATSVSQCQKMLGAWDSHRALTKYPGCKNIYWDKHYEAVSGGGGAQIVAL